MKIRKTPPSRIYILLIDGKIIAMSEMVEDIYKYISQFQEYFTNHTEYQVICETNLNSNLYLSNIDYILHYWNTDIILTDREITFYSTMFRNMYENTKIMISQCMINNAIMKLSIEEKTLNTKLIETLHEKVHSYQSFLDSLDKDVVLQKYIINPLAIKEEYLPF